MTTCAWTYARAGALSPEPLLKAAGHVLADEDSKRIWQEISAGLWNELATLDEDGVRYVVIQVQLPRRTVDWFLLGAHEREILALIAGNWPQKAIAMKLGLSPSCVSDALRGARARLGFASRGRLVRAYCAAFGSRCAALESSPW